MSGLARRRLDRPALAIIVLAFLVRLTLSVPRLGQPPDDPDNYLPLASALAHGEGLSFAGRPTAYRPPLYPLILAPLVGAFGDGPHLGSAVIVLNALCGAAAAVLTLAAARGLGLGPRASTIAGLVTAIDPVLAVQARSAMTETLTAALVAVALAGAARGGPAGLAWSGFGLGMAALARPSMLAGAALAVLAAAVLPPCGIPERLRRAAILGLALACPLIPWAARNARVLGEPIVTTTHGGYTLYLANNPQYYADVLDGPPGAVWAGPNQRRFFEDVNRLGRGLPEPTADRLFREHALRFISDHPIAFLRATAARLGRFWALAPAPGVYPEPLRLLTAAWTLPLWLLAARGLLRPETGTWPSVVPPALILGLTLVHAAYWTDLRMRAPIVPAIAVLAARGLSRRPVSNVHPGDTPGC